MFQGTLAEIIVETQLLENLQKELKKRRKNPHLKKILPTKLEAKYGSRVLNITTFNYH